MNIEHSFFVDIQSSYGGIDGDDDDDDDETRGSDSRQK